jgi:hypothetical protein
MISCCLYTLVTQTPYMHNMAIAYTVRIQTGILQCAQSVLHTSMLHQYCVPYPRASTNKLLNRSICLTVGVVNLQHADNHSHCILYSVYAQEYTVTFSSGAPPHSFKLQASAVAPALYLIGQSLAEPVRPTSTTTSTLKLTHGDSPSSNGQTNGQNILGKHVVVDMQCCIAGSDRLYTSRLSVRNEAAAGAVAFKARAPPLLASCLSLSPSEVSQEATVQHL